MLKNPNKFHQSKFNLNKYSRLNESEYIFNKHKYAKLYCNEKKLRIKINKIKSTN